jgi:mycobactin lysine-N-oxygenase
MAINISRGKLPPLKERSPVNIAVIGGGPKAAALAAKASVLRSMEKMDARITIFEAKEVGANWSGKGGYTNGSQRLCTIAERDVGYPYSSMFGAEVDLEMAATFSWGRYLHSRPNGYQQGFCTWVDAGRKPPYHSSFADYLKWVVDRSGAELVIGEVTRMQPVKKEWQLDVVDKKGATQAHPRRFDAVVVTGPGPARHIPIWTSGGAKHPKHRLYDGRDFWQRTKEAAKVLKRLQDDDDYKHENSIVIVGAGGTAAAILAWLIANGARDMPIQIVASQASLYTRVDSVFENRLFSDETQWATLSSTSRKAFFDRLNRGVVWATVMDQVSTASNLTTVDGRAERVVIRPNDAVELVVQTGDGGRVRLRPGLLIDASGFDAWWFYRLIRRLPARALRDERAGWEQAMSSGLRLVGSRWDSLPALHAPMLSTHVGPGYGSLMVLGSMADRVLKEHA